MKPGALFLWARRCSQVLFLLAFVFVFIKTDYTGSDRMEYAVNILFRLDPFLALVTMLATRTVIALMLPALLVLLLSLLVGRSFCGWFCPMGSLLDGAGRAGLRPRKIRATIFPRLATALMLAALFLALGGFHVAGYLDPFSILVRGLAQAIYPAFGLVVDSLFTFTYQSALPVVNSVTEPIYDLLKMSVLPPDQKYFALAWLSCAMLVGLVVLESLQRRFFCRNLCPVGALLGLVSARGLLRLAGGDEGCGACRICATRCRMGAIDEERRIDMGSCSLCMECVVRCPKSRIGFTAAGQVAAPAPTHGLSRRTFLAVLGSGVLLPAVKGVTVQAKVADPLLVRPPGALAEREFLARCVRCAECIKVCIGNGLQPSLLEAGLDGVFSPRLAARSGYCEYNCTLCGQVCPTGAIAELGVAEKRGWKIGNAWIDPALCLPYANGIPCMVCEEHCPTGQKAIVFREVQVRRKDGELVGVKQPSVIDELCIGCGICEFVCPLPGRAAITITSGGERRNPENVLPTSSGGGYGYG